MLNKFKDLYNRLNNRGTFWAFVGGVIMLANQFIEVDMEWVNNVLSAISVLLVSAGVLNNPIDNSKGYIPMVTEPKDNSNYPN